MKALKINLFDTKKFDKSKYKVNALNPRRLRRIAQ